MTKEKLYFVKENNGNTHISSTNCEDQEDNTILCEEDDKKYELIEEFNLNHLDEITCKKCLEKIKRIEAYSEQVKRQQVTWYPVRDEPFTKELLRKNINRHIGLDSPLSTNEIDKRVKAATDDSVILELKAKKEEIVNKNIADIGKGLIVPSRDMAFFRTIVFNTLEVFYDHENYLE